MTNLYKVPKAMWKKWSEPAQESFNTLYSQFLDQEIYTHPKAEVIPKEYWSTTAFNCAWMGACEVQRIVDRVLE